MIPVYQTVVERHKGDCLRACVASMFELKIEQVPHFVLYKNWGHIMFHFYQGLGYNYQGTIFSETELPKRKHLINGAILAGVPSKTFKGAVHAVLINSRGKVIHDPNPNKKWLGINIIKSKKIIDWEKIEKIKK